jgi:SAM-dependent methyltransferase
MRDGDREERRQHWDRVYRTRAADQVGWFKPHLGTSLDWIERLGLPPDAPIIDIGGGASTLVDDLVAAGYGDITVLDISAAAIKAARERVDETSAVVAWLRADVTEVKLPVERYRLWHDRAVFHFLTDSGDRRRYRDALLSALAPDGHAIIATFSPEAPPKCSGLPVRRYTAESLADELGPGLELVDHVDELHVTPGGVQQQFVYCLFGRA